MKMTRTKALALLNLKFFDQPSVIEHCLLVEKKAVEIAKSLKAKGVSVNVEKVSIGALLHDIGRCITHDIRHWYYGGKILRELGYPEFARFAETHGGGLTKQEAMKLGLPTNVDYTPRSLEEKIVAYADKFVESYFEFSSGKEEDVKRVNFLLDSLEPVVRKYEFKLGKGHPAVERLLKLEKEIKSLLARTK